MHVWFRRLLILSTFLSLGLLDTFYFVMANGREVYQLLHLRLAGGSHSNCSRSPCFVCSPC